MRASTGSSYTQGGALGRDNSVIAVLPVFLAQYDHSVLQVKAGQESFLVIFGKTGEYFTHRVAP